MINADDHRAAAARRFLDSSVLPLAVGGEHPLRRGCREVLATVANGRARAHVTTEAVQELVFHRRRRRDEAAVEAARLLRELCVVHAFDGVVLDRARDLMESTRMRGRDAVRAAAALGAGFDEICTADPDFDDVPGLRRVSADEWLSRES